MRDSCGYDTFSPCTLSAGVRLRSRAPLNVHLVIAAHDHCCNKHHYVLQSTTPVYCCDRESRLRVPVLQTATVLLPTHTKSPPCQARPILLTLDNRDDRPYHLQSTLERTQCLPHSHEVPPKDRPEEKAIHYRQRRNPFHCTFFLWHNSIIITEHESISACAISTASISKEIPPHP